MKVINSVLDACKSVVKRTMRPVAAVLNKLSGGKVSPNSITALGFAMHIPIALLIANGNVLWAALLLVVFGLFDTLDGELARLQGTSSPTGMLLDSTTDRMKEIILYIGIAYFLVSHTSTPQNAGHVAVIVTAACGGSVLVSYVNAWGEAILGAHSKNKHAMNQTFRGGLMRFEVRMALLVVGLLSGWLLQVVAAIAVLAWLTAGERLQNIIRRLK